MEEVEPSKLAVARYRKGWSQQQVAEAVGAARSTLSQWERGVQVPQEFYVQRLCDFYQMTRAELGLDGLVRYRPRKIASKSKQDRTLPLTSDSTKIGTSIPHELQDTPSIMQVQSEHGITLPILPLYSVHPPILERLSRVLTKPSTFDKTTFQYLETSTIRYWRDRHSAVVASPVLLSYVLEHLQKILVFLESSLLPSERKCLCSLASVTAQLVGHLLFDLGDYLNARKYHREAIKAAQEANNTALEAIAWGRMSFTWTYSGNAQKALPYIQRARYLAAEKTSLVVQAYLSAVEAEVQAILENREASLKALDDAACIAKCPQNEEDTYWLRFNRSRLEGYQGTCFRRFYNSEDPKTASFLIDAQKSLKDALALLVPSMIQRRPALLIDLASTYAQQKEIEEACEHLIQAIIILAKIQSKTGVKRLLMIKQDLESWSNTQYVKAVDSYIEALVLGERKGI
jgi:transcriptional regulator with XRE-family HTH domain/tetratricopeptide (TPR) repeat protein